MEQPTPDQVPGQDYQTVTSTDGTSIAYDRVGEGPPVLVIGGGLNRRVMFNVLVELLSEHYTVYNYDRRGRGDSGDDGDPEQYSIDIELDDLRTMLEVIGEPAYVLANCTGGMLAAHAVAQGAQMAKLAMYEPPYTVGADRPVAAPDYLDRLKALVAEGHRDEAVMLFYKEAVGLSDELIARFRGHFAWPMFAGLAHTLPYERVIVGDGSIPDEVMRKVNVPTLILEGERSPSWQRNACVAMADLIPGAQREVLEGQGHVMSNVDVAPYLEKFFAS